MRTIDTFFECPCGKAVGFSSGFTSTECLTCMTLIGWHRYNPDDSSDLPLLHCGTCEFERCKTCALKKKTGNGQGGRSILMYQGKGMLDLRKQWEKSDVVFVRVDGLWDLMKHPTLPVKYGLNVAEKDAIVVEAHAKGMRIITAEPTAQ